MTERGEDLTQEYIRCAYILVTVYYFDFVEAYIVYLSRIISQNIACNTVLAPSMWNYEFQTFGFFPFFKGGI